MRRALFAAAVLAAATSACKRREPPPGGAAAPAAIDAGRPPAQAETPLPACDKNAALARSLEKLFKTKPNDWQARAGRFPAPGCAVVATAGENCTESPDETNEPGETGDAAAVPRRLVGVLDPVTGALRAGQIEEMSGLGESCFTNESITAVLDLDGDGTDELVTGASSSHHAENRDTATVYQVDKKRVSRIGWIPISYEAVGRDDDEAEASCNGTLTVVPASADGGAALELTAKVEGKGELTKEDCLPGRRRYRVAGGKLVARKVGGKPVTRPTR